MLQDTLSRFMDERILGNERIRGAVLRSAERGHALDRQVLEAIKANLNRHLHAMAPDPPGLFASPDSLAWLGLWELVESLDSRLEDGGPVGGEEVYSQLAEMRQAFLRRSIQPRYETAPGVWLWESADLSI